MFSLAFSLGFLKKILAAIYFSFPKKAFKRHNMIYDSRQRTSRYINRCVLTSHT